MQKTYRYIYHVDGQAKGMSDVVFTAPEQAANAVIHRFPKIYGTRYTFYVVECETLQLTMKILG